jgi:hypothetical protein
VLPLLDGSELSGSFSIKGVDLARDFDTGKVLQLEEMDDIEPNAEHAHDRKEGQS